MKAFRALFLCWMHILIADSFLLGGKFRAHTSTTSKSLCTMQDDRTQFPINTRQFTTRPPKAAVALVSSVFIKFLLFPETASADDQVFKDVGNGFSLFVPPGWSIMPRKTPTPSMLKYSSEESLLVASCFAEGASLGITRSNGRRLLKDFDIEWWFGPLNTLTDFGTPELIAELLILQRQGDFETKRSTSEIFDAKIEDNTLSFRFRTPLAQEVNRVTLAKACLRGEQLIVVWISCLSGVWESDYAKTIENIRDSFALI